MAELRPRHSANGPKSSSMPPRASLRHRGRSNTWAVALVLLLSTLRAACTTVAIYRSPTKIVIGADTLFNRQTRLGPTRYRVCKILNVGEVFFVSIGIVDNPATGFSLNSLAETAIQESHGVSASAQKLMSIGEGPVSRTLTELRKNESQYYSAHVTHKEKALGVVFVGFDAGQDIMAAVYFSIAERADGSVKATSHLDTCPGIMCPSSVQFRLYGQSDASSRYLQTHPLTGAEDPVSTAMNLIGMEADADPDNVGRPIDIITISPKGHRCSLGGQCCK
jgi:hypothetical protein